MAITALLTAEIGDCDETLAREHLKASEYLPSQGRCLDKILELHRKHTGQTPAESDFQVLEIARKLELYGIRFHRASDREGTKINLAVSHMGILVFQDPPPCAPRVHLLLVPLSSPGLEQTSLLLCHHLATPLLQPFEK